ncbi:hypothetical protein ACVI1N_007131 [Sinorhizobium medicae]
MQHWLDKLTDLTAIEGDECILKTGLADVADHFGFTGYAYLHIQHKHWSCPQKIGHAQV